MKGCHVSFMVGSTHDDVNRTALQLTLSTDIHLGLEKLVIFCQNNPEPSSINGLSRSLRDLLNRSFSDVLIGSFLDDSCMCPNKTADYCGY